VECGTAQGGAGATVVLFTTRLGTPTRNPITPVIKLSTNLTRAAACPTSLTMTNSAPLTERRYVAPFILITSLFFLWAFGVNLNDILIPRFKNAFALSDFQSSFIQVAFFSGYCLADTLLCLLLLLRRFRDQS
jgi:D-galactarate/Altronate dehydratase, C-terminal